MNLFIWGIFMKVIVMNKRKIQVVSVAVILMAVLFGIGHICEEHIKSVSFIQNNIKTLTEYKGLDGWLTYKLPSEWTTKMDSFPGNDIIYHNDFQSKDGTITGFVQVWNMKEDLKGFLSESKQISTKQNQVSNYTVKDIDINGKQGYLVKYNILSEKEPYSVQEYFIKNKNKFIRFSFFVKKRNFKEYFSILFYNIVKTLKINPYI